MNKRPVRKANNVRKRRKGISPIVVFAVFSLIVGLTVFAVSSIIGALTNRGEPTERVQGSIATTEAERESYPTPPTEPKTEPDIPVISPEPEVNIGYVKEEPPTGITYAHSTPDTATPELKSESVILIDVAEGSVVASRSPDKRVYPASLTKVMTLITAYDFIENPYTERFIMTDEILRPLVNSANSRAGFEVGEDAPLIDYMYGMIMFSGADASEAIAVHCSGSVDAFVNAMNAKARSMGLTGSHFTNPIGTHDKDHYSTVHDMALILEYAYEIDILKGILDTYKYTTSPTNMHPDGLYFESNIQQRMVGNESGTCYVSGGKTGFTNDAGHCLLAYATSEKTGKRYIFAATGGKGMYDPIWDCINTLKDYVE